jgi:hypothetical protein
VLNEEIGRTPDAVTSNPLDEMGDPEDDECEITDKTPGEIQSKNFM